ncbi:MAG: hypothetical protein VX505_01260 [Chloroflexota bacterium]|nr:hypothetical protein [Chloroflexota bacterium]
MGVKFEQRYYVVGENKAYDIISGDSDAGQAVLLAALASGAITSATCREITTSANTSAGKGIFLPTRPVARRCWRKKRLPVRRYHSF